LSVKEKPLPVSPWNPRDGAQPRSQCQHQPAANSAIVNFPAPYSPLPLQLQNCPCRSDNLPYGLTIQATRYRHWSGPFSTGDVTSGDSPEKIWGAILIPTAEGLCLSDIELASFEDLTSLIQAGDPVFSGVVFFPMQRLERVELDFPQGNISSASPRSTSKTLLTRNMPAHFHRSGEQK
jgi:hypothetical protein